MHKNSLWLTQTLKIPKKAKFPIGLMQDLVLLIQRFLNKHTDADHSVTQALFLFQSMIPVLSLKNRFNLLLLYSKCIDGKREVKAVMFWEILKIWMPKYEKKKSWAAAHGMNYFDLSKKAEFSSWWVIEIEHILLN